MATSASRARRGGAGRRATVTPARSRTVRDALVGGVSFGLTFLRAAFRGILRLRPVRHVSHAAARWGKAPGRPPTRGAGGGALALMGFRPRRPPRAAARNAVTPGRRLATRITSAAASRITTHVGPASPSAAPTRGVASRRRTSRRPGVYEAPSSRSRPSAT